MWNDGRRWANMPYNKGALLFFCKILCSNRSVSWSSVHQNYFLIKSPRPDCVFKVGRRWANRTPYKLAVLFFFSFMSKPFLATSSLRMHRGLSLQATPYFCPAKKKNSHCEHKWKTWAEIDVLMDFLLVDASGKAKAFAPTNSCLSSLVDCLQAWLVIFIKKFYVWVGRRSIRSPYVR